MLLKHSNDVDIKLALLPILEAARIETGFNPHCTRLIVDILPVEDGGRIIMFAAVGGVRIATGKTELESSIYTFGSPMQLCAAFLGLYTHHIHRIYQSALYIWNGEYHLIIKTLDYLDRQSTCFLGEFARLISTDEVLAAHICEHGKEIISKNAVAKLGFILTSKRSTGIITAATEQQKALADALTASNPQAHSTQAMCESASNNRRFS